MRGDLAPSDTALQRDLILGPFAEKYIAQIHHSTQSNRTSLTRLLVLLCLGVRTSDSLYHSSRQMGKAEKDFEGKLVHAPNPLTHAVMASEFNQ